MVFYNIASYLFLLVYSLLLVFGTWSPLTDWDWSVGGIRGFLAIDIFEHMSRSDNLINLVVYIPFGFVAAHLLPGSESSRLVITTLLGCLVSVGLEFGQTFLPGRFTSLSDIIFNTTGTLLGALGTVVCHRWLSHDKGNPGVPPVIEPLIDKAAQTPQRGKS